MSLVVAMYGQSEERGHAERSAKQKNLDDVIIRNNLPSEAEERDDNAEEQGKEQVLHTTPTKLASTR